MPVLLDGAAIPEADQLPDDLKKLVRRHAEFIEHRTVDTDVERLIKKLRLAEGAHRAAAPRAPSSDERMRGDGRILVDAPTVHNADGKWFKPGAGKTEWFKDHEHGPEMVVVPAGEFTMGSNDDGREEPIHKVTITRPFAVGRFAITFDEWDACAADGKRHRHRPDDQKWGRGKRPVINVSWDDAKAYASWLSGKTGKSYRLLSDAEREYVTRAGTTTEFWWGSSISTNQANYGGSTFRGRARWPLRWPLRSGSKGEFRQQTLPVGSFEANPWGLYQVHGNVGEWCEDVWHDTYKGAPLDGSAWLQGGDASRRVTRGGSWLDDPRVLRAAFRYSHTSDGRSDGLGFRLARTF